MTSRVTKQVLKEQIEALREENARLMDEIHGESLGASRDAGSLTVDESSTVTLEAHRQAMEDLQAELEDSQERSRELDRMCTGMDEQIRRLTMEAELDKLRAVEAEHSKWEAREERLVQQLRELQSQLSTTTRNQGDPSSAPAGSLSGAGVVTAEKDTNSTDLLGVVSATCTDKSTDNSNVRGVADSVDPLAANCMPTIDSMGSLLLAQQMPQITKFAGEDLDNEPFEDWLTQFEMIAGLCKWVGQAKLVHLTTRLRGPAFAFYRSCSAAQKSNYQLLVSELKKRFTPVHIQAVQTSRFHERRQKSGETVDDYAQELRKLFRKAYPTTARGSQETEQMGQTVLSSQFVAGLLPDIKSKVAGVEGDLEKLLTKARFEEAKLRELAEARKTLTVKPKANSEPSPSAANPAPSGGTPTNKNVQCHACGAWGHKAFQCPKRDRGLSKEAKQQTRTVHALTTEESPETEKQGQVTNRKQQLIDAEVDAALGEATVTMHTVTPVTKSDAPLGPVLTAEVELEGTCVRALVDTGSPVTIVSLKCLVDKR